MLNSKGPYIDKVNRAKGEAEAIELVASATAKSIKVIAQSIQKSRGEEAISLKIVEQYMNAFGKLAKDSNTIILPANLSDPGSFVTSGLGIFNQLKFVNDKKTIKGTVRREKNNS